MLGVEKITGRIIKSIYDNNYDAMAVVVKRDVRHDVFKGTWDSMYYLTLSRRNIIESEREGMYVFVKRAKII